MDRTPGSIRRRDVLVGAAGLATAAAALTASAQEHSGHAAGAKGHYTEAQRYKKHVAAVEAAEKCVGTGRRCLSHCLETFVAGDTTMGECAFAVEQMLRVCDAFAYIAAYDSKRLPEMARACIGICEDCEKACREHEEHQPECKACADACAALIVEARKLV
jgi:Cys-rich four helix bundle protein (predicted Tat secretion target)